MFGLIFSTQHVILKHQLELLQNIPGLTWVPQIPLYLLNKTQEEIDIIFTPKIYQAAQYARQASNFDNNINQDLPDSFDWTESKPLCVRNIRDQKSCIASQLFAQTSLLSDLRCIKGVDKKFVQYSEQYQINCYLAMYGYGCSTDSILVTDISFLHLKYPYGVVPASCVSFQANAQKCPTNCDNGSELPPRTVLKSQNTKNWDSNDWGTEIENQVKSATIRGPILMQFSTYTDLMFYSSGVYIHQTGDFTGKTSGEVVGYGVENGIKFWKMKIPFGEEWGENGFLKIAQTELDQQYWEFVL
ncbi:Cathepsin_B [Hexamita inflata]|uniref:Cathepsin B n=1 Tax=Hexamita inflata TaxID=28002 RepID=A0AA86R1E1_9EUKA|nr:Cathepsin B [Hexamita inflata]